MIKRWKDPEYRKKMFTKEHRIKIAMALAKKKALLDSQSSKNTL
jgi:hypothetical protein